MTSSSSDELPQKLGFFATRIVEANNEQDAIEQVLSKIQNDPSILNKLKNPDDDIPNIEIEAIKTISTDKTSGLDIESINKTYMFYPDDEDV